MAMKFESDAGMYEAPQVKVCMLKLRQCVAVSQEGYVGGKGDDFGDPIEL